MRTTIKMLVGIVVFGGGLLLSGCESTLNTTGSLDTATNESLQASSPSSSSFQTLAVEDATAANDGLVSSEINTFAATNFVTAGTGTASREAEEISVELPEGAQVEAVYLYWARLDHDADDNTQSPSTILVNGTGVTGAPTGYGAINNPEDPVLPLELKAGITHRADLTNSPALDISTGVNTFTVQDNFGDPAEPSQPLGASVVVFYSVAGQASDLLIYDGADYLWADAGGDNKPQRVALQTARPVTFSFEAADEDREADLTLFIGDVEPEDAAERPNSLLITIGNETTEVVGPNPSPFQGFQGPEWDNYNQTLTIPAGVDHITIEPVSGPGDVRPASLLWSFAGLSIQNTPPPPKCECDGKVKELTLKYTGKWPGKVLVKQENGKVVFYKYVKRGQTFTIKGKDRSGTFGSKITIYVNWKKNTRIYTDCSKPIGPGLESGSFKVVSGIDKNGNELCAVDDCDEHHKKDDCDRGKKHKWDKKDHKNKHNRWKKDDKKNHWGNKHDNHGKSKRNSRGWGW